jgi:trigger factor
MQEAIDITKDIKYPIVQILDDSEYCKLKIHYEADPDIVSGKADEAVAECRKFQIPGFRKGKAPDSAIRVRLKNQINQYVVREMATQAIDDVIFELNVKLIGYPKYSNLKAVKNNFSCDIELVKKPEFELGNFKFEIPKPNIDSDEDSLAEKSLYNLRMRVGETLPYEEGQVVEIGDQITFSFVASIEDWPFDGSIVEGELYTVGTNRWVDFDQNILGLSPGDTKEFDFEFKDGTLAGKIAHFTLTVHMGTRTKPHPLNEEFYALMGVQNIEELLKGLKSVSKMSMERNRLDAIRTQVSLKLLEANQFKVPQFIIDEEAKSLASRQGVSFDSINDSDKLKYQEQAEKNSRLSLILDSIRENEPDSVLNEIEARNSLSAHLQAQGVDPEQIFKNHAHTAVLLHSLKDEFTLQWLANQATIIE